MISTLSISDRIYISLCGLFAVLIVTGNLVYQKFVILPILPFHTFELSIGAVLYPFTFMISDLLAEFYGREKARFCVKLALSLNILIAVIIFGMDHLTATAWSSIDDPTFHKVFGHTVYASLISVTAAYISQRFDIYIYLYIRNKTGWLGLSNFASTGLSLFIDTCIVVSILNFFELIPANQALWLIFNGYLFKICLAACNIPVFYACVAVIRRLRKSS
ncbi:MAG: queuosine precursor transporter [Myxococcaceae bacterium]